MRPTRHIHRRSHAATTPRRAAANVAAAATVAALGVALLPIMTSAPSAAAASSTTTTAAANSGAKVKPSAQTEYLAAMNAVGDQGVHFTSHAQQGKVDFNVVGDTGVRSGKQTLSLKQGSTFEHLVVIQVGSSGYVTGNKTALLKVIGLSTAKAEKYAGKWISFPATQEQYSELVGGLLDSQVADELKMSAPFHYAKAKTVDGKSAIAIVGSVSDDSGDAFPSTLYVPASGTPLPLEQTTTAANKKAIEGTVSFTHWGESVTQKAPAHATPLAKLAGVATSGTTTTTG